VALVIDDTVDLPADIQVDTVDGRVTLHGNVDSPAAKSEAEVIARGVPGVIEVRNLLAVVPRAARDDVRVSDAALKQQVNALLERDQGLAGSDIEVKSVHAGTVLLAGRAKTLGAHRRALEDASAVPGVRQVASEIRSPDRRADAEIWQSSGRPGAGTRLASSISDGWITTRAKLRLIADPGLSPSAVEVDTSHGVVTLFGTVVSEDVKTRAEAEVREVDGVKGVANELQVVPEAAAKRIAEIDDRVQHAVRERLGARDALDDSKIDVAVVNGVVRLTGTVASQRDRVDALAIARNTDGVGSVIDGLELILPTG